jgi:hypothetical protein
MCAVSKLLSHLNHATVVAYVALFVALGGGAYAAIKLPKNSVGTKQLKNGAVKTKKLANRAVTGKKLANGAVTGAKVANNSLTGQQINAATLGTVPHATSASQLAGVTPATVPVAWARIGITGTVIAGSGISNSNVIEDGSGKFCFVGLPFAFHSAQITVDFLNHSGIPAGVFSLGAPSGYCVGVTGTQAAVITYNTQTQTVVEQGFFITFYN